MITVVKKNPLGEVKIQYTGEVVERLSDGVIISARWQHEAKDLGYTRFEPGDQFIEYYYTDRWFNIFDISTPEGIRKGWYCNIAEPALIYNDHIEQIDLLLDVWVNPEGQPLLLDEDEFEADTTLSDVQRNRAGQGLHDLLQLIAARETPFLHPSNTRKDKS